MGMAALMEILTHQVKDKQVKVRVIPRDLPKAFQVKKKISFTYTYVYTIDLYLHVKLKLYAHIKNTDIDVHINVPTQMYLHIHTDIDTYITPLLHLHLLNFLSTKIFGKVLDVRP